MRLITKFNTLQESYHNLQIQLAKYEIENSELRRLNKELIVSTNNTKIGYEHLRDKIINNPETILYHIKLSKIENYLRKVKLKRLNFNK